MVAGGGMIMPTAFSPFLLHQSKKLYGMWYNAARGLTSMDIAVFPLSIVNLIVFLQQKENKNVTLLK